MLKRPRIIVVTAGKNQAPLLTKAKEMGFEVLVTDINPNASSAHLADHTAVVDASDFEGLLAVARQFDPQAIVSEQTDAAVQAVAYVADELGLPGIGYHTAIRATDKWEMREACRLADIPTPDYRLVRSPEEAIAAVQAIGLPTIIKPVDSQSSRGVTKVGDVNAASEAAIRALTASRSGRALVEQQMMGAECSIESFVSGDTITVLGISEKRKSKPPFSFDLQLIYPGSFSPEQSRALTDFNASVIAAIGIRMGFVHAELMLTSDGVRLIEVAARGCGARVATDLLPQLTGIDLLAARLRQAMGEELTLAQPQQGLVGILRFFEFKAGIVRQISGLNEAAELPGILHLEFSPKIGAILSEPQSGDQRPGFVLATAASREEAIKLANKVVSSVRLDIAPVNSAVGS